MRRLVHVCLALCMLFASIPWSFTAHYCGQEWQNTGLVGVKPCCQPPTTASDEHIVGPVMYTSPCCSLIATADCGLDVLSLQESAACPAMALPSIVVAPLAYSLNGGLEFRLLTGKEDPPPDSTRLHLLHATFRC